MDPKGTRIIEQLRSNSRKLSGAVAAFTPQPVKLKSKWMSNAAHKGCSGSRRDTGTYLGICSHCQFSLVSTGDTVEWYMDAAGAYADNDRIVCCPRCGCRSNGKELEKRIKKS